MRRKGQTSWNSEPTFSKIDSRVLRTGIARKLEVIGQAIDSMATQKDLALFLKKPENAQKLNGLVQDIRYALVDYQVCSPKSLTILVTDLCSDFAATRHLQRGLSADRESHPHTAPPFVVTCK